MEREEIAYRVGYRITESGNILNKKGVIISGSTTQYGYKMINVIYKNKRIHCFVHRIQAFQKYGQKLYEKGIEVRHLNGIKTDNSYENILIGSHHENMMDRPESIRISFAIYAASFLKKYDNEKVRLFHENNGRSYKKTMSEFNISSKGTLNYILTGVRK